MIRPTPAQRDRVMRLRADGWTLERIARVMKIDPKTLDTHFAEELEHGADVKADELIRLAEKAAKRGSVGAIRWLSERRSVAAGEAGGKKEQRQRAAEQVDGVFAPPQAPKLVVSNG